MRTETSYVDWACRYILFHGKRHPEDMGAAEVEAFLTHLAVERQVSASTQNQARSALRFLYKEVLGIELPWLDGVVSAKQSKRLPVVLTQHETRALLTELSGTNMAHCKPALWFGFAVVGGVAPAGEGCGIRATRDRGPRGQGRQGSGDGIAGERDYAAQGAF